MRLVLASRSPRRAALLRDAGYVIDIEPADVDERRHGDEPPRDYVTRLATAKSATVAGARLGRLVVGADTIVLIDGVVFGKPADRREARQMLARLTGRTHTVLTGVAVTRDRRVRQAVEETRVTMSVLDASRIAWYADTGEPDDKAGGYAVQGIGSRFIERIDGSYTNVVGLPMTVVDRFVRELGC